MYIYVLYKDMLSAILGNSDARILHRLGQTLHKSVVQALYETAPQESFSGVSYKITYKKVFCLFQRKYAAKHSSHKAIQRSQSGLNIVFCKNPYNPLKSSQE
jgi:hypothetical protein